MAMTFVDAKINLTFGARVDTKSRVAWCTDVGVWCTDGRCTDVGFWCTAVLMLDFYGMVYWLSDVLVHLILARLVIMDIAEWKMICNKTPEPHGFMCRTGRKMNGNMHDILYVRLEEIRGSRR